MKYVHSHVEKKRNDTLLFTSTGLFWIKSIARLMDDEFGMNNAMEAKHLDPIAVVYLSSRHRLTCEHFAITKYPPVDGH